MLRDPSSPCSAPHTFQHHLYLSRSLFPWEGALCLHHWNPCTMQIGRSPEEREHRFQARECLYCGKLGHRIASCPVRPKDPAALNNEVFAAPVKLIASSNDNEAISFFTFPSPDTLLIFGFPWLQKHNTHTDWTRKKIASCSSFCLANCPPGLCFVPNTARGAVIHWAARFLCHPGVSRTITLLRRHFCGGC